MASEWRNITLGDFVTIQRGHDLTSTERREGKVPVVGAAGQNGFHDTAIAKGPGIVIGRCGGSYGQVHYCEDDFWPHNTGLYVTDFKGNDQRFAFYLLKLINFDSYNSGSAQPSLNRNFIYPIPVRVPLPAEQKAISGVLTALDAKIELNQRINAELEGMAKLLYDYWFVQFDFPMTAGQATSLGKPKLAGHPYRASGGKMIYNQTLKRDIPEGWTDGTLEDVLTLQYGKALKKEIQVPGDYPVYGSGGIYGSHNVPLVKGPGIIVGRKGSVGELHWSNASFYPTDTSYYVEPKAGIDLNYAYFLLQRLPLKSMNSDSAVPGLSRSAAYRLPATRPAKSLIAEFGKFTAPLRSTIANNEQQNQELTQLRDWLLPMFMNGQVTVG